MRRTLIVVPMKDPAASKTRLSDTLSEPARRALTRQLYRLTLEILKALDADLAVVTASAAAKQIAADAGVGVIAEAGAGLSDAVDTAARWAQAQGYGAICVIPADLAAPELPDLRRLLARAGAPGVVVCPAGDLGTNGLLVSPPTAIPFRYGPRSALRHMAAAEDRGLTATLLPLDSLKLDIDTSDHLARALIQAPALREAIGA